MTEGIKTVVKRNGETVPFDQERITVAIYNAAASAPTTSGLKRCARPSRRARAAETA